MAEAVASSWTVCQIGARENYAVARALHRREALERLITDVWMPAGHPLARASAGLAERQHSEIPRSLVCAPTGQAVLREGRDRVMGRTGWAQIMGRNAWFQRAAVSQLKRLTGSRPRTVFAYSYAAAEILAYAKQRGWQTVLGQIDPGPVEARLVRDLYLQAGDHSHEFIPEAYWDTWRRETALADTIVVNSPWSRDGLVSEGVPAEKIEILPLAYEPVLSSASWDPPAGYTPDRPLRLLFLGQVTLRKGVDLVLEAMRRLPDLPLHLDVVGPVQIALPDWVASDPRITLHGGVPRSAVGAFYAKADLFLFPTRSDGFGLTQLEALSAGVPVIASARCGAVVEEGANGHILSELSAEALAEVLAGLVQSPASLTAWRSAAQLTDRFSLETLGDSLLHLTKRPPAVT